MSHEEYEKRDGDLGRVEVFDVGLMGYREAWDLQVATHERVLGGELGGGALILGEHPAVVTVGRRAEALRHLLVSPEELKRRGVELVETDRGGDITFHGPGQLVVYPILNLNVYGLNLHGYMRLLEEVVIETVERFGVEAFRVEGCTGVWVADGKTEDRSQKSEEMRGGAACGDGGRAKICAIGIKLRRWTTLHGLALNVDTDMGYFGLINACGLSRPVASMRGILGEKSPGMVEVKREMVEVFGRRLGELGWTKSRGWVKRGGRVGEART